MDEPITIFPSFLSLPQIRLSLFINIPVLIIFFFIFFVFYAIISSVIVYHWSAYGMKSRGIIIAEALFFGVSFALFAVATLSLFYF